MAVDLNEFLRFKLESESSRAGGSKIAKRWTRIAESNPQLAVDEAKLFLENDLAISDISLEASLAWQVLDKYSSDAATKIYAKNLGQRILGHYRISPKKLKASETKLLLAIVETDPKRSQDAVGLVQQRGLSHRSGDSTKLVQLLEQLMGEFESQQELVANVLVHFAELRPGSYVVNHRVVEPFDLLVATPVSTEYRGSAFTIVATESSAAARLQLEKCIAELERLHAEEGNGFYDLEIFSPLATRPRTADQKDLKVITGDHPAQFVYTASESRLESAPFSDSDLAEELQNTLNEINLNSELMGMIGGVTSNEMGEHIALVWRLMPGIKHPRTVAEYEVALQRLRALEVRLGLHVLVQTTQNPLFPATVGQFTELFRAERIMDRERQPDQAADLISNGAVRSVPVSGRGPLTRDR